MNKFFTLAVALCCVSIVNSQQSTRDLIEINPRPINFEKKLPFNHIDIVDSRYDTTKIGYAFKGNSLKRLSISPSFSRGIQNSLNTHLQSNFDLSKKTSLLIVIKNFWLKNAFIKKQTELGSQCIIKIELYLKDDTTYFPLVRIDTVYTHEETLKNSETELVILPFEKSLAQLENINFEKLTKARKLSWSEIDQYNKKRFEKPIYSAALQKGIYLTFKDFLENRIDNRQFEISYGKQTDQLYIIDKGDRKLFSDFWAFCDGKKLYINGGFNFYELIKIDNGFEFWGNERVIDHVYNPQFKAPSTSPSDLLGSLALYGIDKLTGPPKNFLVPFQVNMENGTLY